MKAVVLEIRKNEVAVLCEDGQIVKIRKNGLTVGETVEISSGEICPDKRTVFYKKLRQGGAVAAAVAILLGFGGNHVYNTALACSYVSLDINPSIEYTLNRQDRVLDVTAVNEDAEEIVAQLKANGVKKESLSEAISMTADLLQENGYITDENTDYILINVASDDDKKSAALKKEAQSVFDEINADNEENIHLTLTESTVSERKEAREQGVSAGEYREIRAIGDKDVSKYKDMKVKDLLESAGELGKTDSDSTGNAEAEKETETHSVSSGDFGSENSGSEKSEGKAGDSGQEQSGKTEQSVPNSQGSQKDQNRGNQKNIGNDADSRNAEDNAGSVGGSGKNASQEQAVEEPAVQSGTAQDNNQGQKQENNAEQNTENNRGNSEDQNGNSPVEDGQNMSGQENAVGNGPEGGKN